MNRIILATSSRCVSQASSSQFSGRANRERSATTAFRSFAGDGAQSPSWPNQEPSPVVVAVAFGGFSVAVETFVDGG